MLRISLHKSYYKLPIFDDPVFSSISNGSIADNKHVVIKSCSTTTWRIVNTFPVEPEIQARDSKWHKDGIFKQHKTSAQKLISIFLHFQCTSIGTKIFILNFNVGK
jgi:hypothetical protein